MFMWGIEGNTLTKRQRSACWRSCKRTTQISATCWIARQITASRQNHQKKKEVSHTDTGVGNGTQPSAILNILDNWIYSLYAIYFIRIGNYMWL